MNGVADDPFNFSGTQTRLPLLPHTFYSSCGCIKQNAMLIQIGCKDWLSEQISFSCLEAYLGLKVNLAEDELISLWDRMDDQILLHDKEIL